MFETYRRAIYHPWVMITVGGFHCSKITCTSNRPTVWRFDFPSYPDPRTRYEGHSSGQGGAFRLAVTNRVVETDGVCTYHQSHLKKARRHGRIPPDAWDEMVDGFEPFSETGIEPTVVVPVFTGEREVISSSWGFRRAFASKRGTEGAKTKPKPVVNAQSEKMDSFMWKDAYLHRRCVVVVTAFYEWIHLGGQMMSHRFHRGGDAFLVAGLWEENPGFGFCHTMVTTLPNREILATGHDRCLVVLADHEVEPWLRGEALADFRRTDGIFQVESGVRNPREKERKAKPKPTPPAQGELF